MSEISSATLPREPRLHVAVIGALGIGDRQHETGRAVEEAELEQIDAQERPDAVRDTAERGNLAVGDLPTLSSTKVWVGDGTNTAAPVNLSGDVTIGNTGLVGVTKVQGQAVSSTAGTEGQIQIPEMAMPRFRAGKRLKETIR